MTVTHKSSASINVLLVEDNTADANFVEAQITQSELDFTLIFEESLYSAAQRLKHVKVDVILLDLTLPDSSGLETFTKMRAKAVDIPIVILSGYEDTDLAVAAVSEGAQDYLPKAKIDGELLTRSIRYAIERSCRQQAEKALSAAGAIQRQLLPKSPPHIPGLDISGRCESATFAGGDYFDFFPMRENQIGIAIADVAGHGVGPALMMSETRAILRTLAPLSNNVGDILTRANRVLASDLDGNAFIALFLTCLDPKTNTFKFAGAGHPGFVLDGAGKIKRLLKTTDPPLGVDPKFKYVSSSAIPLDANDGLFLYTDGLVECVDANGVQFGKKRLFELVREIYCDGASQIIAKIFSSVEEFSGHVSLDDDMTTVLVKAQTTQTEPVPSEHKPSQPAVTVASYKHFEVESVAGATLLRLCDNSILNSEVCNELQREFVDFANQAVPKRLLISFREVERLSSEMISSLLRFREAIESKNGSLRLCEISPTIREAFAALNLDGTVFNIEDNVDAAIKSFES